jgi:hypothetical protein
VLCTSEGWEAVNGDAKEDRIKSQPLGKSEECTS